MVNDPNQYIKDWLMPAVVYLEGHVKMNPETGDVAIRTIFPEDAGPQLAGMAWLIATKNVGARHAPTGDVEAWDDLFEPEAPVVPEAPILPE